MRFELQVRPSPAHAKPQQPLQTFRSFTFNDCHSNICPCWRNMTDEGPDSEIFDSEHHHLPSLERYLACQWTRICSGDQSMATSPTANLLARVLHMDAFLYIHTHNTSGIYTVCFHISMENALPLKDSFTDFNRYKFFVGKCSWQEKVSPTDCLGSIFSSSIHSPNSAFVTVTEYLPTDFSRARPRLYSPWQSHHTNIGKHLKIFTTVFVAVLPLGDIIMKCKKKKVDKDEKSERNEK